MARSFGVSHEHSGEFDRVRKRMVALASSPNWSAGKDEFHRLLAKVNELVRRSS